MQQGQQGEWAVPGTPVRGYVWEAQYPRGVVLLSHGIGEYAQRYVKKYHALIPTLVENGFSVYAYDQRGHGASAGRRAVVNLEVLTEDHLKAREALRQQEWPVFLFGHSMGGLIAAASASRDPRGLSGVILSSPALLVGEEESVVLKKLVPILAKVAPASPVTQLDTSNLSRLKEEVAAYEADDQIYHGKVAALSASSMLGLSQRLWKQYPRWQLPTLIFHGSEDKTTDPRGSQRFAAMIPATDKTYIEFKGGYHELLNDAARAEVRELVVSWLRGRTK